ncbi:MAG: acyl-CoA reductase [Lentimicrobiaceae bacterium]|nr:acyl-CoA reductase [Lentimicrobiaceae bacterium]
MELISLNERISALHNLSILLDAAVPETENKTSDFYHEVENFKQECHKASVSNPWFELSFINYALSQWAKLLKNTELKKWVAPYSISDYNNDPKKVAVVMAGNIPIVGMHDFVSVLITGNIFIGKCSHKDDVLLPAIANLLCKIQPKFKDYISFESHILPKFDKIIATGSDNTAKYFNKYVGKYPSIIRKNMNSVAVIDDTTSKDELSALSDDICLYFGLGCRSVSKIYIPNDTDIIDIIFGIEKYRKLFSNHHRYSNNYVYRKSIYLINNTDKVHDNGFMLFQEDTSFLSPISVINYQKYSNLNDVVDEIKANTDRIQCVVGSEKLSRLIDNVVPYGLSQQPQLSDYADGVDTINFLK